MPHLYQQPPSQDQQHPAGYQHGGAVPPPQTVAAPPQTAQHVMTMVPPPHVSATQQAPQAAAQHPQITPPHPYSTNPYGISAAPSSNTSSAPGGAAIPPMAMHPHHAAAYQAGFASALQAAQAQQAQAQHAQHVAMYGIPAGVQQMATGHPQHPPQHHAHLPYRPSAVPPSSLAAGAKDAPSSAAVMTISPGIKREDSAASSAEDIAVSALSMLCGAALGDVQIKKEEDAAEQTQTTESHKAKQEGGAAVPVEGSPSFVEESKKTTAEGASAAATAMATAATTSAAAAAHISPASTVGSAGAEGTPADAGADPSASASDAAIGKPMPHFPSLLHDVLTNSRHAGSVLEWLPHGQGWRVLRWDEMARTVLPEHFPQFCPSSATAMKAGDASTSEKNNKKEEDGEDGDNTDSKAKAKQPRRKPPMLPLRSKVSEGTSPKGAGDGDVNAFLSHVRAWGFQEVRDGGPDMGSYRHAVSVDVSLICFLVFLSHHDETCVHPKQSAHRYCTCDLFAFIFIFISIRSFSFVATPT